MNKRDAINILLEHVEAEDEIEFMEKLIADECHNPAICPKCEEVTEVEPDALPFICHNEECGDQRVFPLTWLIGAPI